MALAPILIVTLDAEWSLAPEAPAVLAPLGHPVAVTPHGPAGLMKLATSKPVAVVVEVLDLERHGTAFARIIRERPSFEQLPLLAVTQAIPLRAQASLLLAGYDRVLAAPRAAGALTHAVREHLAGQGRVPGLLEAYGRAAAIAVGHAAAAATRARAAASR